MPARVVWLVTYRRPDETKWRSAGVFDDVNTARDIRDGYRSRGYQAVMVKRSK